VPRRARARVECGASPASRAPSMSARWGLARADSPRSRRPRRRESDRPGRSGRHVALPRRRHSGRGGPPVSHCQRVRVSRLARSGHRGRPPHAALLRRRGRHQLQVLLSVRLPSGGGPGAAGTAARKRLRPRTGPLVLRVRGGHVPMGTAAAGPAGCAGVRAALHGGALSPGRPVPALRLSRAVGHGARALGVLGRESRPPSTATGGDAARVPLACPARADALALGGHGLGTPGG
jgi:hypothetical protein